MKRICSCMLMTAIVLFACRTSAVVTAEQNPPADPSVVEVQKAALAYHHVDQGEVPRWKKRARLSALLPHFEVGYDRRVKNDVNVDISENVYVGSSGVTVGPSEGGYKHNANSDQNVHVKAVWYLGELLFNPEQIDISRESRSLMRERQMLMAEVNKHYYERSRMRGVIDMLERGKMPPDKKKTPEQEIFLARVKYAEETAALDALTGGWFSSRIQR